ncbi:phosphatase 2C [Coemansia javaensis]|uniref:Phosphatase 2C n=1 Tax=Coemansia javaensis TaxID=2761396 RepID=A0A9W8LGH5_9FUNG|nr:phosphatase 2C [Coemansia javaensis]
MADAPGNVADDQTAPDSAAGIASGGPPAHQEEAGGENESHPETAHQSAGPIQLPPRLQRSSVPPPIDTEDATKDQDDAVRTKILSAQEASAAGVAPLVLDDVAAAGAGDQPPAIDTACPYIGVAESKNRRYRRTMEDAHYLQYDFEGVPGQVFMAVFDGHAGRQAAQWCGDNFADIFLALKAEHPDELVPEILNRTFIEADRRIAADLKTNSGCTAAVAFVQVRETRDGDNNTVRRQRTLFCANAGDARAVLSRRGTAKRLTYDHKGEDKNESDRISEAGGFVFNGRVNGVLAVTRSLGDASLKQFVIGNPYTTETKLDDADDVLLILACDGLWDVCSDQAAVDLVRAEESPARASEILLQHALDNESTDNITVMVLRLPALN